MSRVLDGTTYADIVDNLRGTLSDYEREALNKMSPDRAQAAREERRQANLEPVFRLIEHVVNNMSGEPAKSLAFMLARRMHRTLQQSFMRDFIIPFLREMVKMRDEGFTDLRNEASCNLAADMLAAYDKSNGLPMV
jgi:hypothetical protein